MVWRFCPVCFRSLNFGFGIESTIYAWYAVFKFRASRAVGVVVDVVVIVVVVVVVVLTL